MTTASSLCRVARELHRRYSIFPNINYDELVSDEIMLKTALYNHICNPLKRWQVGRIVPYKLFLQLFKTILVLIQV